MKMRNAKQKGRLMLLWCLMAVFPLLFFPSGVEARTLKLALVLPEGSAGAIKIRELMAELKRETGGEVDARLYAGGVAGDESDVLRKMRVNRIQGAAFSSIGLRQILPKITLFELPGLFRTYDEIDHVREMLYEEFDRDFDRQGFVLLGLAEVGFSYFFMQQKIQKPDDFQTLRMWSWKGDEVMQRFIENFRIPVISLHVTDVRRGLQAGMIDAVMSPPMAANAFQWHPSLPNMFDHPLYSMAGALIMNKRDFETYSPESRAIMKEALRRYTREWVGLIRQENEDALAAFMQLGIRSIPFGDEYEPLFSESFRRIETEMIERGIVDAADVGRIKQIVADFRASRTE